MFRLMMFLFERKTRRSTFCWIIAFLFSPVCVPTPAVAQQQFPQGIFPKTMQASQVVDYGQGSNRKVDFSKAVIGIEYGGKLGAKTKSLLMKLGAHKFSEGPTPCVANYPVICFSTNAEDLGPVSGSGEISAYGNRGGISSQSSFSGNYYQATVNVDLRLPNKAAMPLATCSETVGAGYGSSTSSSYSRSGSGTFNMQGYDTPGSALGMGVSTCINRLLVDNFARKFWHADAVTTWYRGAADEVDRTFMKQ